MEWSAKGKFTNFASLTFVNRYLSVPKFSKSISNGELEIVTDDIKLKYNYISGKFSENNLIVEFKANNQLKIWKPGSDYRFLHPCSQNS